MTMRPHVAANMSGNTAWQQWNVPVRFTSIVWRHSSIAISSNGVNGHSPADVTSASIGP